MPPRTIDAMASKGAQPCTQDEDDRSTIANSDVDGNFDTFLDNIGETDADGDKSLSEIEDPQTILAQPKSSSIAHWKHPARVVWADLEDSESEADLPIRKTMKDGHSCGDGFQSHTEMEGPVTPLALRGGEEDRQLKSSLIAHWENPARVVWADLEDSESEADLPITKTPKGEPSCGNDSATEKLSIPNQQWSRNRVGETARAAPHDSDGPLAVAKQGHVKVTHAKGSGKVGGHNAGSKGQGKRSKGKGKGSHEKLQCQFVIGIEDDSKSRGTKDSKFSVARRIISNCKWIAEQSGAKLRLRGRGSNFLEGIEQKESKDPLMLCISSEDKDGYQRAKDLTSTVLLDVYKDYGAFCGRIGRSAPDLCLQIHDGPREGSR